MHVADSAVHPLEVCPCSLWRASVEQHHVFFAVVLLALLSAACRLRCMMRQIRVIKNTNTPQAANATFAETNHCRRRYPCRRRRAVANSSATVAVSTIAGHTTNPLPIPPSPSSPPLPLPPSPPCCHLSPPPIPLPPICCCLHGLTIYSRCEGDRGKRIPLRPRPFQLLHILWQELAARGP